MMRFMYFFNIIIILKLVFDVQKFRKKFHWVYCIIFTIDWAFDIILHAFNTINNNKSFILYLDLASPNESDLILAFDDDGFDCGVIDVRGDFLRLVGCRSSHILDDPMPWTQARGKGLEFSSGWSVGSQGGRPAGILWPLACLLVRGIWPELLWPCRTWSTRKEGIPGGRRRWRKEGRGWGGMGVMQGGLGLAGVGFCPPRGEGGEWQGREREMREMAERMGLGD